MTDFSGSPLTVKVPSRNSRSSGEHSSWCAAIGLAFSMTRSAAFLMAWPADGERSRAVGVHAVGSPAGVAVDHVDVLDRDAEDAAGDLAPGRLMALAVRRGAGDQLDLARREQPDRAVLPAAGRVLQSAQGSRRSQAAHLGEGRDADAQLDGIAGLATRLLLGAQLVDAEQLERPCRGRLVVAGVVGESGDRRVRELVVLDPVAGPQLHRVHAELGGQLVDHALDRERRLGPSRTADGVGRGGVGEHAGAAELVRVHLVDRRGT